MSTGVCLYRILRPFLNRLDLCDRCYYAKVGLYSSASVCGTRLFSQVSERVQDGVEEVAGAQTAEEVLRKWGCDSKVVEKIFQRYPPLRKAVPELLETKLSVLSKFGVRSSDLVTMIYHRPCFLGYRFNRKFEERLENLLSLFGAKEVVLKAIVRNPSLLLYKFREEVEPVFSLYERMGIGKDDLISVLIHRPTLIPRTNFCEHKLDYIRRTGLTKESKLYKYVVSILGVSRLATIREKIANLEKFGFSEDEVLHLFGRSPLLMTLSVDKVQRNMTFVMGTMKLPASTVVDYPFLLCANLETTLRPRVLLAGKILDMGLEPQIQGPVMLRALRMTEERFLKAFVRCHEKDVSNELLEFYNSLKDVKRLAASSKKQQYTLGFPF